ncbi:MAG TPA: glycoside hydrolase family 16 protein [Cytophagaceae bacterium]
MILNRLKLVGPYLMAGIIIIAGCKGLSFVQQPDLYQDADSLVEEDPTPPGDKGYKSPLEREGWKLVWQDEFDGPEVDTTKWNYEVNGDGGGNNELQYYVKSKRNVYIKDGKLVIKGIKENYKGKFYTSGRLNSSNKADFKYGRFDIRARLPIQQGIWPAIWMLPTDWVYGGWPLSGEIDIMEIVGHEPSTLHGTLHYGELWPKNKYTGGSYKLPTGTFEDEYHVFSVEWEENEIRWYIDDQLYSTKTPKDTDPHRWPFDQKFHFLLNLAIGGTWPGPPDEETVFPKYFFIDYVRVFQKE